jgi:LysM domain
VKSRFALVVVLCAVMAVLPLMTPLLTQAEDVGPNPNLLVDGDFEVPAPWPWQDGIGEVQVAPGWRAWYLDKAPDYVKAPSNCFDSKAGYGCYWMRPEFRDNVAASFENRVHGGVRSQKYFSFGRMHEAGLYQRVGGIKPGSTVRFSIYIQAWQCYEIDKCGRNGTHSDQPADMHLRVGIDPYGGDNPFSGNVVWAPEMEAFDRWVEFAVQAQAKADTVTVFTHSRPEWGWARVENDVYLDDASLVVVQPTSAVARPAGQAIPAKPLSPQAAAAARNHLKQMWRHLGEEGLPPELRPVKRAIVATTPTSPPPPLWAGPTPVFSIVTPTPTSPPLWAGPTPVFSSGPRTHVIVPGDTLTNIAARYNTTVAALMQANNITDMNLIFVGLTLVIP